MLRLRLHAVCIPAAVLVLTLLGGCGPEPPCQREADCADGDDCTTDACVDGACVHESIENCQSGDDDGDGGSANDNDVTDPDPDQDHPLRCEDATECSDSDPCTNDSCEAGTCVNAPVDCDDGDRCTSDACVDGECLSDPIEGCNRDGVEDPLSCEFDAQCSDDDYCTIDTCVAGACVHDAIEDCPQPAPGSEVGILTASKGTYSTGYEVPGLPSSSKALSVFGMFSTEPRLLSGWASGDLAEYLAGWPGVHVEKIAGCTVTTFDMLVMSQLPTDGDVADSDELEEIIARLECARALDAGTPGRAETDVGGIDLVLMDLGSDPSALSPAAYYMPDTGYAGELLDQDSDAREVVTFSFPGGTDVGAFTASVTLPPEVTVVSPDLADPDLELDLGSALPVHWEPRHFEGGISIAVIATYLDMDLPTYVSVSAVCDVVDDGSATIPAQVMAALVGPGDLRGVSFRIWRQREVHVDVPLPRVGGTGVVTVTGSTNTERTIYPDEYNPIPEGYDPCTATGNPCAENEVCNLQTLECDPA